jgi:hypothetical protein
VDVARTFHTQYSDLDDEGEADDEALDDLEKTIDSFAEKVSNGITQLDEVSELLIQMEMAQRQNTQTSDMTRMTELLAQNSAKTTHVTALLAQDSANMKLIAILTALFLPGTFMAVRSPLPSYFSLTEPSVRSCSPRQCSNGRTLLTDRL